MCMNSCADVEIFLTELSSKLIETFAEVTLGKVFSTQEIEFGEMQNQFERMMKDACLFCQRSELSICKYSTVCHVPCSL